MEKKYEFTGEVKEVSETTLRRIRACRDFGTIKAGDIGGWIESEENLSHYGACWVLGDAQVVGDALVYGNARVFGDAQVLGDAQVGGDARVFGDAQVFGDARVYENAWVGGDALVFGDAQVFGDARVYENARVYGDAQVMVVGPIGSRYDYTTFYKDKDDNISVNCGCFNGNIESFFEAVEKTHGHNKHAIVYKKAIEMARTQIDNLS